MSTSEKFAWPQVGEMLQALRGERKLTMKQVQDLTGLSKPTLISAERGGDIQLSTFHTLLKAYGVDPASVFKDKLHAK